MANHFPQWVRIWFFFEMSVPPFISSKFGTMKLPTRQDNGLSDVLRLPENEFQDGWLEVTIIKTLISFSLMTLFPNYGYTMRMKVMEKSWRIAEKPEFIHSFIHLLITEDLFCVKHGGTWNTILESRSTLLMKGTPINYLTNIYWTPPTCQAPC